VYRIVHVDARHTHVNHQHRRLGKHFGDPGRAKWMGSLILVGANTEGDGALPVLRLKKPSNEYPGGSCGEAKSGYCHYVR
jgi:hypothetical protein